MPRPDSESILDYVIPWQGVSWPLDLESLFGRRAETVLEIGFGDGEFLCDLAERRPERNYLGIEVAWKPTKRLFRRLDTRAVTNIRVVCADAGLVVGSLLQTDSITECFINHPDPWRKDRHHERRLIRADFMHALGEVTAPDGRVTIATDHAGYARWIAGVLENQTRFRSELPATTVSEIPGRIRTRYERKARRRGIRNHFFVWRNVGGATPPRPAEEPLDMPNVTLEQSGEVDFDALLADIVPRVVQDTRRGVDVVINMVRIFAERGEEQSWMVETVVREGRLTQHVGLLIIRHTAERLTVKTSPVGFPRATWGVKRAVQELTERLVEASDRLRIAHSTVG